MHLQATTGMTRVAAARMLGMHSQSACAFFGLEHLALAVAAGFRQAGLHGSALCPKTCWKAQPQHAQSLRLCRQKPGLSLERLVITNHVSLSDQQRIGNQQHQTEMLPAAVATASATKTPVTSRNKLHRRHGERSK